MEINIERQPGGIRGLIQFIQENREALTFDLLPLGLRVEWAGTSRFPWDQVKAFITYAPSSSAIVKVDQGPAVAAWDLHADMLANIEYYLAMLVWAKTTDGAKNINPPKRRHRPAREKDAPKPVMSLDPVDPDSDTHVIGGRGVPIDDMADMLGWARPPADLRR